ncbi:MAG: lepB [Paucimonas sp.]|nr:lepB [Paucimonas sp.]
MFGMLFVRTTLADWYAIPTGSMYPTLLIGDRVVSNKLAYDIKLPLTAIRLAHVSDPQRGDIVTFSSPIDGTRLVKRLVAIPGDRVEMRGSRLLINGIQAEYRATGSDIAGQITPDYPERQLVFEEQYLQSRHSILLMPERLSYRDFGPVTVPDGKYLMLGDSRDNSADSRFIGFVRRELLTGRVERIAFSLDAQRHYLPRFERVLSRTE